ncbi:terminase small subunit [Sphingobacterium chungjuense]|uniref:terminase small subunit n=1 Tax=Sphingobacterium chungjuense TaxID=2675553 RepID=UPI0019D25DD1|nr:terminase small subunit [Sphingobacterium chungjuense]
MTVKQEQFCQEYVIDLNATQAAEYDHTVFFRPMSSALSDVVASFGAGCRKAIWSFVDSYFGVNNN